MVDSCGQGPIKRLYIPAFLTEQEEIDGAAQSLAGHLFEAVAPGNGGHIHVIAEEKPFKPQSLPQPVAVDGRRKSSRPITIQGRIECMGCHDAEDSRQNRLTEGQKILSHRFIVLPSDDRGMVMGVQFGPSQPGVMLPRGRNAMHLEGPDPDLSQPGNHARLMAQRPFSHKEGGAFRDNIEDRCQIDVNPHLAQVGGRSGRPLANRLRPQGCQFPGGGELEKGRDQALDGSSFLIDCHPEGSPEALPSIPLRFRQERFELFRVLDVSLKDHNTANMEFLYEQLQLFFQSGASETNHQVSSEVFVSAMRAGSHFGVLLIESCLPKKPFLVLPTLRGERRSCLITLRGSGRWRCEP